MSAKQRPAKKTATAAPHVAKAGKTGIVVVDDHPIVREGLVRVIDQTADLVVVGQADTLQRALATIAKTKPGLVIVDISLAGQNGVELIKDIRIQYPQLPVLAHSMYDETVYAERCLRAGAKGYVMKQAPSQILLKAIRQVLQGEIYVSESMTKNILHRFSDSKPGPGASILDSLSDREFEVLELIGRGHGSKEIAEQLHLSQKTVQTHREHIKSKLNLKDAASLMRYALQWVEARK